jgi:capsular exopolysaccharide synthesis family protein
MQHLSDQISQQQRLIALYRDQTAAETESRRVGLGLQIQNLETELKEWDAKALVLNQKIAEYERLKSKVDRTKILTERLLATVQNVDVNKSLGQDAVTIMEHASPPVTSKPGLVRDILTGGAVGLMCGLGIVVAIALLDDKVTSVLDVRNSFDEEVLAQIPQEAWTGPLDVRNLEAKHPMLAEAARNLRSSLLFMPYEGEKPKSFLVTSSIPGEGKSTISTNLAIALAATGSRTLLVDGDLGKGILHGIFNCPPSPGLAEVLRREVSAREALRTTDWDHLMVLPRGRNCSDASELYLRESTDDFLRQMYQDFDYIVFDTAPVLVKEDTASLAPKIDAALLVIRAGVTPLQRSRSALQILEQRNVNLLGVVFNSASKTSPGYYYDESYYGPAASADAADASSK